MYSSNVSNSIIFSIICMETLTNGFINITHRGRVWYLSKRNFSRRSSEKASKLSWIITLIYKEYFEYHWFVSTLKDSFTRYWFPGSNTAIPNRWRPTWLWTSLLSRTSTFAFNLEGCDRFRNVVMIPRQRSLRHKNPPGQLCGSTWIRAQCHRYLLRFVTE